MGTKLIQIIDVDAQPYALFRFPIEMSDEEIGALIRQLYLEYNEDVIDDVADALEEKGYERVYVDLEVQL